MWIHYADTSNERGQFNLLGTMGVRSGLLSYHYRSAEKDFAIWWNELMKLHFVHGGTDKRSDGRSVKTLLPEEDADSNLLSYAHKSKESNWTETWNDLNVSEPRARVIIDSGAFTAFTCGEQINIKDYASWAIAFEKRWKDKMSFLRFMNLDVIGDQDQSWMNQSLLEHLGLNPIPIITYGADKKDLEKALNHYDLIALGGLVPYVSQKEKLKSWLDYCFFHVMAKYRKTEAMPKIHLLGVTSDWVLKRYPCYSSDSSSWVSCLRFGGGQAAGIKKIPKYTDSPAALSTTIHVLRCEIKKYKKMEEEATNLWKSRGIVFNE